MKKTILISILAILLIAVFVLPINQEQTITKSQTIINERIPYIYSPIGPVSLMTYVNSIRMYNADAEDHNYYVDTFVEIYEEDNVTLDNSPSGNEICSSINLTCKNLEYKVYNGEWNKLDEISCTWDDLTIVNNDDVSWFDGEFNNYHYGVYAEIYGLPVGPILYLKEYTYTILSINDGFVEIKVSEGVEGHASPEIQNISVGEKGIFTTKGSTRVYVTAINDPTASLVLVRPYEVTFRAACSADIKPKPTTYTATKTLTK